MISQSRAATAMRRRVSAAAAASGLATLLALNLAGHWSLLSVPDHPGGHPADQRGRQKHVGTDADQLSPLLLRELEGRRDDFQMRAREASTNLPGSRLVARLAEAPGNEESPAGACPGFRLSADPAWPRRIRVSNDFWQVLDVPDQGVQGAAARLHLYSAHLDLRAAAPAGTLRIVASHSGSPLPTAEDGKIGLFCQVCPGFIPPHST